MSPRLNKDEKSAVDQVMSNIEQDNIDPQLRDQVRNDIIEAYAEARTDVRRNAKKIILEAMGFNTRYAKLAFHGTFDRRHTDVYYSLTGIVDPLIKTLSDDISSRIEGKFKIEDSYIDNIADEMIREYRSAFDKAAREYKYKLVKRAEEDFEKLMPLILGSNNGATGEELHAEFIMNVISGKSATPKLELDQDLINAMLSKE